MAIEHVVMKDGGAYCRRCKARLAVKLPCVVDEWCAAMDAFVKRHASCPKPAEVPGKPQVLND